MLKNCRVNPDDLWFPLWVGFITLSGREFAFFDTSGKMSPPWFVV